MSAGTFLLRFLALVMAFVFVVVSVGLLLLVGVEGNLLTPVTYRRALLQQDAYRRLSEAWAEQMAATTAEESARVASSPSASREERDLAALAASAAFRNLTKSDWQFIVDQVAPPEWIQKQAERAIDEVFASLEAGAPPPKIRVSLVEMKTRIAGNPGRLVIARIVGSWPECSSSQLAEWSTTAGANIESLPVCRPPAQYEPLVVEQMARAAGTVAEAMPSQVVMSDGLVAQAGRGISSSTSSRDSTGIQENLRDLQWLRQRIADANRWGWVVPVGPLLVIALLAVRSWRGLAVWWGLPILVAGGVTLSLALSSTEVARLATEGATSEAGSSTSLASLAKEIGVTLMLQMAGILAAWLTRAGAIVGAIGLVTVALSPALPGRHTDTSDAADPYGADYEPRF